MVKHNKWLSINAKNRLGILLALVDVDASYVLEALDLRIHFRVYGYLLTRESWGDDTRSREVMSGRSTAFYLIQTLY